MTNNVSKKKKSRILRLILGVSMAGIIACGIGLGLELRTKGQGQAYYAALSSNVEHQAVRVSSVSQADEPEDAPAFFVDFDALRESFPSLVAWIISEGTPINYPIMQGADNAFYLSHLPDDTKHSMGSIFLDNRNTPDFSDQNTLIYGHETKSGDMFGSLKYYREQVFYDEHPTMSIYTPENDYELILIAGYVLDSTLETPPMKFKDKKTFDGYIKEIKRRSVFKSEIEAEFDDRLVCLCTCSHSFKNARLVIVGKLAT